MRLKQRVSYFLLCGLIGMAVDPCAWSIPILAVGGEVTIDGQLAPAGTAVVVENAARGLMEQSIIGGDAGEGRYAIAFIDMEGGTVAEVSDKLVVTIKKDGEVIFATQHSISDEDIRSGRAIVDCVVVTPEPGVLTLNPAEGSVGAKVSVSGSKFLPNAAVGQLRFGGREVAVMENGRGAITNGSIVSDADGAFDMSFIVPERTPGGPHDVTTAPVAPGTSPSFTIIPRITDVSPTIVITGDEVAIKGDGFRAGESYTIRLGADELPGSTAGADGLTEVKFNVPKGDETERQVLVVTNSGTVLGSLLTVGPWGPTLSLEVAADPNSLGVDGKTALTSNIIVTARDRNANLVPDESVSLTLGVGAPGEIGPETNHGDGRTTVLYTGPKSIRVEKLEVAIQAEAGKTGVIGDAVIELTDAEPPTAAIEVLSTQVGADQSITLNGGSSTDNVGLVSYSWDFDVSDGIQENATELEAITSYPDQGTRTVTLTVTDSSGNQGTDTVDIWVGKSTTLTITNTNGSPISGARVELVDREDGAILNSLSADEYGRCSFVVPSENYKIHVSAPGYVERTLGSAPATGTVLLLSQPNPPTGLRLVKVGSEGIAIVWGPNPEPDIAGYNVYRSNSKDGPFEKINPSTISDSTEYLDLRVVPGKTFWYYIKALNTGKVESKPCDPLRVHFVYIELTHLHQRAHLGEPFSISGKLYPALLDVEVALTTTKPDGTTIPATVTTTDEGGTKEFTTFRHEIIPDQPSEPLDPNKTDQIDPETLWKTRASLSDGSGISAESHFSVQRNYGECIIILGDKEGEDDGRWNLFRNLVDDVSDILTNDRRFGDERIHLMNAAQVLRERDGAPPAEAIYDSMKAVIESVAKKVDSYHPLLVILVGHWSGDGMLLAYNEEGDSVTLPPQDLDNLLRTNTAVGTDIRVVLEMCYAARFIQQLQGTNRTIIASAGADQESWVGENQSFLLLWFRAVSDMAGHIGRAFKDAREQMLGDDRFRNQIPELSDNGSPMDPDEQPRLLDKFIGDYEGSASTSPRVTALLLPQKVFSDPPEAMLWATAAPGGNPVAEVSALIYSPCDATGQISITRRLTLNVDTGKYEGQYELTERGLHLVEVFATDSAGRRSSVRATSIDTAPWDVNHDHVVDILDLTSVGLRFGESPPESIDEDVNGDGNVDILDVTMMGMHFGERHCSTQPAAPMHSKDAQAKVSLRHEPAALADGVHHVDILVKSRTDVHGFQFDVAFDPGSIEVLQVLPGAGVAGKKPNNLWLEPKIHQREGTIRGIACANTMDGQSGKPHVVVTIAYQQRGIRGEPGFTLTLAKLADRDAHPIPTEIVRIQDSPVLRLVPEHSALLPNYPNPFNPETWIPFHLGEAADVSIRIFDMQGRLVRTMDLGTLHAGSYVTRERAMHWDGRNAQGEPVVSGLYLCRVNLGSTTFVRRMLMLK